MGNIDERVTQLEKEVAELKRGLEARPDIQDIIDEKIEQAFDKLNSSLTSIAESSSEDLQSEPK